MNKRWAAERRAAAPRSAVFQFDSSGAVIGQGDGRDDIAFGADGWTTVAFNDVPSDVTLTAPPDKTVAGCNVGNLGPLTYSETPVAIMLTEFQAEAAALLLRAELRRLLARTKLQAVALLSS
jgi:hypothetical protein